MILKKNWIISLVPNCSSTMIKIMYLRIKTSGTNLFVRVSRAWSSFVLRPWTKNSWILEYIQLLFQTSWCLHSPNKCCLILVSSLWLTCYGSSSYGFLDGLSPPWDHLPFTSRELPRRPKEGAPGGNMPGSETKNANGIPCSVDTYGSSISDHSWVVCSG